MGLSIKLVQRFLTMISEKLSPDNVSSGSKRRGRPQSRSFRTWLLRGRRAGSAGTCCPLAALGVSASPSLESHTPSKGQEQPAGRPGPAHVPGLRGDSGALTGGKTFVKGGWERDEFFSACLALRDARLERNDVLGRYSWVQLVSFMLSRTQKAVCCMIPLICNVPTGSR